MDLTPEQKFEALKMRYEDHVELLRFNARQDLEIFGGYITLQGVLAGFLAQMATPPNIWIKVGIIFIDLALTMIAFVLRKAMLRGTMKAVQFGPPDARSQTVALALPQEQVSLVQQASSDEILTKGCIGIA